MKDNQDRLKATIAEVLTRHRKRARERIDQMIESETPWKDRTVADVTALKLVELEEAESRATKLANRPASVLGVVVVPQRVASNEEWEAAARRLEASGRSIIDTTVGPAIAAEPSDEPSEPSEPDQEWLPK